MPGMDLALLLDVLPRLRAQGVTRIEIDGVKVYLEMSPLEAPTPARERAPGRPGPDMIPGGRDLPTGVDPDLFAHEGRI